MIIKLDKEGNEIFTSYIGSENSTNKPRCFQSLPEGGWVVAGYNCGNSVAYDKMFWMELNSSGELIK